MDFASPDAEQRYDALVAVASGLIVACDFDGTLSPIVDDPTQAHIHPDAGEVLSALAPKVLAIAIVTGRPARQVVELGGLEALGDAIAASGRELHVFGQYGNERWSSSDRTVAGPPPPEGLATFVAELPRTLRAADAADAWVEEKGLAVAVHTRRLPEPEAAFARLLPLLREQAEAHDLIVEPGRNVVEVRAAGMDKGLVVDRLITELGPKAFLFAGDDLGDVDAFETVGAHAKDGLATLLVCSASEEQPALTALADVVVPGPDGVLELLRRLASDIA
ncbi:trehalose 6-phosphate phosphatase [Nocardioides terrae]|uniref:Trehalose 6-phosphate phosphatase n=1 Tax=Nocardioides terrae TaxID=574651 RepID=A0A1I1MWJ3_9ACTN|nr:trehalose-phosphatase [Nocardioides terrae]SFC89476.1 trehalose 6-phosphate phosphatase [Nocardioides terrae]